MSLEYLEALLLSDVRDVNSGRNSRPTERKNIQEGEEKSVSCSFGQGRRGKKASALFTRLYNASSVSNSSSTSIPVNS